MLRLSRRSLLALLALTVAPAHMPALADSYPSRPVTIIVPLAAGTGMDTLARLYAEAARSAANRPESDHLTRQAARLNAALRA